MFFYDNFHLFTKLLSRKNFIKTTLVGITSSLFYKCKDDPLATEPEPEPEPEPDPTELTAKIIGNDESRLPVEGDVTLSLDGKSSEPKDIITDFLWDRKLKPDENFTNVGSGETLEDTLNVAGDYEYKLTVENSTENTSANVTHSFSLYAALLAKIIGTKSEPFSENGVSIDLDGTESIGEITEYEWSKRNEENEFLKVGTEPLLNQNLTESGTYRYKLTVKDPHGDSEIIHDISIVPETPFIGTNFMWFYKVNFSAPTVLCKMDMDSFAIEEVLVDEEKTLVPHTLCREPNGNRLVVGKYHQEGHDLYTYDIKTKTFEQIQESRGNSWKATWNPHKNWVVYSEDARYWPGKDRDELALINPDTKQIIYLSGDVTSDKFVSLAPAWNSLGEKIAGGNTRYYKDAKQIRRISIYSDVFNGNPTREQLHTEKYLENYFGYENSKLIREGPSDVAWSPDNSLIAYNIGGGPYGILGSTRYINAGSLAIANADGSGIVKILKDIVVSQISWSPDSQKIVFKKFSQGSSIEHIGMVDRNGNNFVNINAEIGKLNDDYAAPTWAK